MNESIPYQNFSSFILRSPLFPFNFIESLISGRDTTEEQLREVCDNPVIREAIFLASPDLYAPMQEWLKGELEDAKKLERMLYSLTRYLIRMSSRPTPFGLFAGFRIGRWAEETRIELLPQSDYSRHTRMDMNYLCALALDLAKHPVIKENIKFYINSSIYPVGEQLRYVEYRYVKARRTHHIVAVDHSEYLQRVLDKAARGAYLKELAGILVDDEISLEEANEFIEELIDSQLLVNDLEPAITGPEFLHQVLAVLENIDGIEDIKKRLTRTLASIEQIDRGKIGTTMPEYFRIVDNLKPLGTEFELKFMFQTDMVKPTRHCTLDQTIVDDILSGVEVMNRLTPAAEVTNLTRFRDAFFERYESRKIPLLQALDTECGIGYRQTATQGDISPLVDDIALPDTDSGTSELNWDRIQAFLFKKYREALAEKKYRVELTDEDLKPFEPRWDDLPDTFSTMIQFVKAEDEERKKMEIFMTGFGGSGAGNLLGRFCHADPQTFDYVKEITAKEAELNPDVILAEIIHLPEARLGNILLRPVLRDYEIPYLGKPAVAPEFQVKLPDLLVSVHRNRIVLRSRTFNKEIIPRLTSAHNYSLRALPIYHFLCDLQTQNMRGGAGFRWGSLAGEYDFLPRVVYKNIILSPATWDIQKKDIEHLFRLKDQDDKLIAAAAEWRKANRIPAYVDLSDGDNKLLINLENLLCLKTLFSVTKNRPGFQLTEFLFDPGATLVTGREGVFTNEFIVSFHRVKQRNNLIKKNNNGNKK
ncbi:MAG: lantibiotic dehydratase family protein [Candidatus Aminicenantes bacterium]|nr:lantibiotic dehydratase family protein [Candidatus Aminicenantes bacterium]